MDKISYALGLSLGNNLLSSGIKSLNIEKLAKGIQDVLEQNKTEISYQEAQEVINDYFQALQSKEFENNISEGKAFLNENGKREEVITLTSGLQYEILRDGNGEKPKANQRVKVHYEGKTIDGNVFDSSYRRGEPAVFGVTQVIQGWVEALQLMQVGAKWKLYIPSNLAYGAQGAGKSIAPHSALIFDVELLGIEK